MICFLTSRTDLPDGSGRLDPANGFVETLRRCFPDPCRALYVCSDPDGWERMDFYAAVIRGSFEADGLRFARFQTLDGRNARSASELVRDSNLLVLGGGHVPTQNSFFQEIGLRALMKDYDGIVVGISAGSMNSADVVYSLPEEEGEAADPAYQRFLPGLGLTKTMLLPHYQAVKDDVLDGLRVFDDIACPDSMGRTFYAIPDGSYLYIEDGAEELRGEAWMVKDGRIRQISAENDRIPL